MLEAPARRLHAKGDAVRLESADGTKTIELRTDGAQVDRHLAHVDNTCAATGKPAEEVFGDPQQYASGLALPAAVDHGRSRAIAIALALLDGYRQLRPLAATQVLLLADLLPIVHFDFALSEVEYFHGATGSTANADIAYHDFLLGHARWFSGPHGQMLLAALRAAA